METCGRYRIVRKIGQGGMAEVFEAVATGEGGFERRVAIKRILPGHAGDPAICRMFVDEARIASLLHDRNLVAVLDYGLADGIPFQVIDFVDGVDASRLTRRTPAAGAGMPVEVALHLCTEVANGLHHAHCATDDRGRPLGIVHRDVSPGNVLVSWGGEVKLGDFGVAFARDRLEHTAAGVTKGKLLYMAPEQMTSSGLDPRTDVFALGCVLHALVAGASPLEGDGAVVTVLAGGELPLDESLPEDVRAIVARATRAARPERFESAAAMASATYAALAQRTREEPSALLRRFLDGLRPARSSPPERARLDDLLEVDLVLTATSDGVRRFDAAGRHATVGARRDAATGGQPSREPAGEIRSRRRAVPLVAVGAVLFAVAIVLGVGFGGSTQPAGGTALAPQAPPLVVAPPPPPAAVAPPAPPPLSPDSAPPVAHAGPGAGRAPGGSANATRDGSPERAPPGPGGNLPDHGFLRIGGASAQNAEILVDGTPMGFAPARLHLAVGSHRVELRRSGRTLASRTVTIGPEHTTRSSLPWMLP